MISLWHFVLISVKRSWLLQKHFSHILDTLYRHLNDFCSNKINILKNYKNCLIFSWPKKKKIIVTIFWRNSFSYAVFFFIKSDIFLSILTNTLEHVKQKMYPGTWVAEQCRFHATRHIFNIIPNKLLFHTFKNDYIRRKRLP